MAEYMNPFAGSLAPETIPNNPFWAGVNTGQNQQKMAPFLQMEQQRQQLGLQKQQIMNQEFMSPEAVDARRQENITNASTGRLTVQENDQKWRLLPLQEKHKMIELRNKIMSEEGKPYQELFKSFGDMAQVLEKTPEQMRPAVYQQLISRFQQTHPGVKLPQQYLQYSPQILQEASNLRTAMTMTPEHARAMEIELQKEKAAMERQRVASGATIQAAQIREAGDMSRARMQIDHANRQTPGQFKVSNMRILNDPKSTPEQLEIAEANLESFVAESMERIYRSDKGLEALSIAALSDPTAMQRIDARKRQLFEDQLVDMGIRVKMKRPDGKTVTIRKRDKQEAIKAGYKEAN